MERITEWYDDGERKGILVKEYPNKDSLKTLYQKHGDETDYSDCDEGYFGMEKLKEYEDLKEQGFLITLACRVGDKLYEPIEDLVSEFAIKSIEISVSGIVYFHTCLVKGVVATGFVFSEMEIGKSVFTTEQEAKEKQEELISKNRY